MYNILLTDDEQIVVDSLAFIIEKNFPDQFNVFKCASGSEAVYTCRTTKIDIIFIDINMPGLNGLESIKEIKQFNPNVVIIVLSAFDRFNYAQEAMALGVYRYLTKPVNRNIVSKTIRSAMEIVDLERGKLESEILIKEKLSFVSSIVESDFIYSSIYSTPDEKNLKKYLEYFKFEPKAYFFVCVELPVISSEIKEETYFCVKNIFISNTSCIIGPLMNNRIVIFVPLEAACDSLTEDSHQVEMCKKVLQQLKMKISSKVKMGVGKIYSDLNDSNGAYNSALEALRDSSESEGLGFAVCENVKKETSSNIYEQRLLARISAGDTSGIKNQLDIWLESLFAGNENVDSIRNIAFRTLVNARSIASEVKKDYENEPSFNNTFSLLGQCKNESDFSAFLEPQFIDCARILSEKIENKQNPVISKAKEYIQIHLSEEISLEQTAMYVKVSPYYLSKLFKDETGSTFIDYVTEKRLSKAKELLKSGDLSIKEVSFETGYSDQNYFSKIFRRKFGVTPTEYKESIQTGEIL